MMKEVVSEGGSLFLLTLRFTHEMLGLRPYESVQFIEMKGFKLPRIAFMIEAAGYLLILS